jgi:DNA helicase-2/ATP-dependent DNA helicase PcrA
MNNQRNKCLPEGLRPTQRTIIEGYTGGRMGISAVPGSGKTFTLSMLAACLILNGELDVNQEVLIVTLSNSAVNNFSMRIGGFLEKNQMLPGLGYRVRTLHGLAHDIVRENPGRLNLANDFSIIDEVEANAIREQAATAWLRANPTFFDEYMDPDLDDYKRKGIQQSQLPRLVQSIALNLIRYAKDRELTPDALRERLNTLPAPLPLAEIGWAVYNEYQRSLAYRGAVDFDDLIRLALYALRTDERLAERLREQWPYILEDEAQDSSRLQEEILRVLAGENGNWVRVGDPNQAIYETFTTANPQHLIDFINSRGVIRRELPVSGRSTRSIIDLANFVIHWTQNEHPTAKVRDALRPPFVEPTTSGDPQPNPPDESGQLYFHYPKMTPQEEMDVVIASLMRWQQIQDNLPAEQRETLAVLDLLNERGSRLANALRDQGIDPVEVLHTTTSTRLSAGTLTHILRYLANPQSAPLLAKAFSVWRRGDRGIEETKPINKRASETLRKLKNVEDFLYPLPGEDWLEGTGMEESEPEAYKLLVEFRQVVSRWHAAALLPIDQVVLTLAQDLFFEPADLAIAHKLASMLRQKANSHPTWHLPELSDELETIARNKRRFVGFSDDDSGFDPEKYRGRIVITTMHKAKGLEWDRVYLLSCNNFDFPSGAQYDQFISEKWFLRGQLNLEAEALEQLKTALSRDLYEWYEEGRATQDARMDTVRERLRLLYVGVTRAKKSLIVTWNSGRNGRQQPSLPFLALHEFIEAQRAGTQEISRGTTRTV